MFRSTGLKVHRLVLSAALAGLVVSGLVVASSGAQSGASTRGASTTKVTLDHFLCYKAANQTGFTIPKQLLLSNVIDPTFFLPKVGAVALHCNPTEKTVSTVTGAMKTYTIKHPLAHLLCWSITADNTSMTKEIVTITNQFGTAVKTVQFPSQLCLPSWKSLTKLPNKKPPAPTTLDHFACYPLKTFIASSRFTIPSLVKVKDEFDRAFVSVKVGAAELLCVPTVKMANGITYKTQGTNDPSLTCFLVSKTPFPKVVYDQNQFGEGAVYPSATKYLCLPSSVSLQGPAG
jgi:hypothetical protein